MFKHFKLASIYVGSIIGAGFASGREIVVFFYPQNFISLFIAALLLGLSAFLFMYVSKIQYNNIIIKILVIIGSLATFIAMLAAINNLEKELNLPSFLSITTGVVVTFVSIANIEKLKYINAILIPVIVVLFTVMSFKTNYLKGGNINFFSALTYVGMNTLLGGVVIKVDKDFSYKDMAITSIMITIIFATLFYIVYKIAFQYSDFAMPILAFAKNNGFTVIYGICVYIAIVTTMISSVHIVVENLKIIVKKNYVVVLFVLISIILNGEIYKKYSEIVYPILGYMGCMYLLFNVYLVFKRIFKSNNFINAFNRKIHYCCHNTKKNG